MMNSRDGCIIVRGANEHNLKHLDVDIPLNQMTVITGPSGSGKSSLAFDTLHAEGKRRFMESLSSYARQFMEQYQKAQVEELSNIPPSIALAQHNSVTNARATVGASTGALDALAQLLYALAERVCPHCGSKRLSDGTAERLYEALIAGLSEGTSVYLGLSLAKKQSKRFFPILARLGWNRILDSDLKPVVLDEWPARVSGAWLHQQERICFLMDRFKVKGMDERERIHQRLRDAIKHATEAQRFLQCEENHQSLLRLAIHMSPGGGVPSDDVTECHVPLGTACLDCETPLLNLTPQHFHYMHPQGACSTCEGYGRVMGLDEQRVIPNPKESILGGAIHAFRIPSYQEMQDDLEHACRKNRIPLDLPYEALSEPDRQKIWEGMPGFVGIRPYFRHLETKRYKMHVRLHLARYRGYFTCPDCKGSRLIPQAQAARLWEKPCLAWMTQPAQELLEGLRELSLDTCLTGAPSHLKTLVQDAWKSFVESLEWLNDVGLGYLPLLRPIRTLSSGEAHRIQLIASISSQLSETLYVLDEPTVGLHSRDTQRLMQVLKALTRLGNTLVLVEHDTDVMREADIILDMGPEGGAKGGNILYQGSYAGLVKHDGKTAQGLRTQPALLPTETLAAQHPMLRIHGASGYNLKNIHIAFPMERLSCITGVSGAGKTSLLIQTLYGQYLNSQGELPSFEVLPCQGIEGLETFTGGITWMDQSLPGRSGRSNAATVVKAYDEIRKLFAETAKAKALGVQVGHFSFNSTGGRCDRCEGMGTLTIDMQFMADMHMECPECLGKRFKPAVLSVDLYGCTIYDVLKMTVDEAFQFFKTSSKINKRLQTLRELGLGYLPLGQSTATLSGGEAQRLKLAPYLPLNDKPATKPCLFLFDEPTRGLHITDIPLLVQALRRLVDVGHTVLVIEHNPAFILQASDWIVDIGPEADVKGGQLVYEGPLQRLLKHPPAECSHTREALLAHLR
jgi:excinuclease ABC subunit A